MFDDHQYCDTCDVHTIDCWCFKGSTGDRELAWYKQNEIPVCEGHNATS